MPPPSAESDTARNGWTNPSPRIGKGAAQRSAARVSTTLTGRGVGVTSTTARKSLAALEKKLSSANNRIESLTSQVKEQVESLKTAHRTINFLRAQKAARSYQVPGLDSPGRDVVAPPEPPKNIP